MDRYKEDPLSDNLVQMGEDAEYKRQLALFAEASTEKGIELVKIGEFIAGLKKRERFLDIGAGGGDLTIPLSQSFIETFIVEPNEKQARMFQRCCPNIKVINATWERVELLQDRFDLVLCSHVLYYIDEGNVKSFMKKENDI